jgi:erythromycin esterase
MPSARSVANSATRFGIVVGLAFVLLPTAQSATQPTTDALQAWIAESSVVIRSVNAADEDFSDLEPLGKAIGSARVVQLGEPSHGAGTGFEAKVRLARFLHARLGFDVLVWESGLYDVRLTEASLRAGEDPQKAALRGIFSIWSASAEVKPLLDYVKTSQTTTRPIEMAGFDLQFTCDASFEHFADDLRSFVHALPGTNLR